MILAFPAHPFAHFLTSGYLLRNPNNSNFFLISLEGLSYWESTVLYLPDSSMVKMKIFTSMFHQILIEHFEHEVSVI